MPPDEVAPPPAADTIPAPPPEGAVPMNGTTGPTLLMGQDGTVFRASADKAAAAIATGQYRPLSAEEALRHQVEKEEEAKGTLGSLKEAGSSAFNQLLMGVPGAIAEETDTPEEAARRQAREEFHSTARLLGGAVGMGASLFAGGGLFKGAELAGQAIEHGILPAAKVAEAALGTKLAATAANYATQGALMASPQAVVQAAFGDPGKAAETLLWGVGAGAALGGAGELLKAGAGAAGEGLEGLVRKAAAIPEGKDVSPLEQFGIDRSVKAIGGERSQINKLSTEQIRGHVDFAHAEGILQPGMSREDVGRAIDRAHDKYGGQIGDVLDSLDGLVEKGTAKEDLTSHAIKPGELGDKIKAALDTPEMRMPMNADQRKALEMVVESAHTLPTTKVNGQEVVAFEDAQNFVSNLRKKWVSSIGRAQSEGGVRGMEVVTPLDQMKSAAYQVARDAVHAAGDRVAEAAGEPDLIGQLAKAKQAYAHVAELDKWAATRERQAAGNRMVGLTDFIHAGQGLGTGVMQTIGAGIGGMLGGAPGAAAGAMVGKLPGTILDFVAKKWAEDKGLVYMSALAHRAAKEGPEVFSAVMASEGAKRLTATMTGVQDTVRRLALHGIEDTKARGQGHMAALLGSTTGLTPDQSYAKLGARLTQLASNPAAMAHVTSALSAPFASSAPQVSDAYQQKLASTIQYLYAALPKAPGPPPPFAPQNWQPTAQEKLAFHDKAEIVANPMSAMQHLKQGTLSDAHLDTLKTVYPVVYGMMQKEVLDFAASHPDVKLPLQERAVVAKFLGAPLGTMDEPDKLRALQASYANGAPGGGGAPPGQKMPKGKIKDRPSVASAFSSTMGSAGAPA